MKNTKEAATDPLEKVVANAHYIGTDMYSAAAFREGVRYGWQKHIEHVEDESHNSPLIKFYSADFSRLMEVVAGHKGVRCRAFYKSPDTQVSLLFQTADAPDDGSLGNSVVFTFTDRESLDAFTAYLVDLRERLDAASAEENKSV